MQQRRTKREVIRDKDFLWASIGPGIDHQRSLHNTFAPRGTREVVVEEQGQDVGFHTSILVGS